MDDSTVSTAQPGQPGHPASGTYLTRGSRFSYWCAPNGASGWWRIWRSGATHGELRSHLRVDVGKVFTISAFSRPLVLEGCHEIEFLQA